jgi:membrane protein
VPIPWRECYIGATITAVLFTIGKFAIGLYLGKATIGSAYGAAGSLVVVIIWVYYSAMIFLFGAEFTHILGAATRPSAPKDLA